MNRGEETRLTDGCPPAKRRLRVAKVALAVAPVAQLDRASDFESAGRPFESDRARHGCRRALYLKS